MVLRRSFFARTAGIARAALAAALVVATLGPAGLAQGASVAPTLLGAESGTLGPVQAPLGLRGWFVDPEGGWVGRPVQGPTTDPTYEILLFPPKSGHPSKIERFTLQVPAGPNLPPPSERALVIGFHPFGVSEKSVFNASGLPQICEQRGWYLLAPYGLIDTNFGNLESQLAVDAAVAWMGKYLGVTRPRVFTVGFSMGGLGALSYAMRNLDPRGPVRIAGVVHHTGTVDVVGQYDTGTLQLKQLMVGPDHFGGTPLQVPFAWDRVNPLRVVGGVADATKAPVVNLKDVPFYLHWNAQDPNTQLVAWNRALRDYLLSQGAAVVVNEVNAGATHAWSTLQMSTAIAHLAPSLPPAPGALGGNFAEIFADRTAAYRASEVRAIEPSTVARYRIALPFGGGNAVGLQGVRGARRIALDTSALSLSPSAPLSVTTWTTDGKPTTIVLRGYASAPSQVLVGGAPPFAVFHDATAKELTITPNASGAFAIVDVVP
jgi:pimeloyl-ACP methyl ester carboxylesterase